MARGCNVNVPLMAVTVSLLLVLPQLIVITKYSELSKLWMGAAYSPAVHKAFQQALQINRYTRPFLAFNITTTTTSTAPRWTRASISGWVVPEEVEDAPAATATATAAPAPAPAPTVDSPPGQIESWPPLLKPVAEDTERFFQAFGSGAPLFAKYGAYRGGNNTFAVVGLGSKALYTFSDPQFECYWLPLSALTQPDDDQRPPTLEQALQIKQGRAYRMLPDMDTGHMYSVVVVNCTFEEPVGTAADERGGQLVLYASHGDGKGKPLVRFVALTEDDKNAYDPSRFDPPFPYEFAYCGSPLYGELNPARVREWLAHHIRLFGPKSHFILHDAGGINAEVFAVIEPWQKLGFVTVENVRQQEEYEGYNHNQFLINNDCLHRTKFMANWTFFFDMDEYIYVSPDSSFHSMMAHDFANLTLLHLPQVRMADYLCQIPQDNGLPSTNVGWALEDLVYADIEYNDEKTAPKYAVQGRGVFATGVYRSYIELGHMEGEEGWASWPNMRYYHYRGILPASKEKNCDVYINNATIPLPTLYGTTFKFDNSMAYMGPLAKQFEADLTSHHWD